MDRLRDALTAAEIFEMAYRTRKLLEANPNLLQQIERVIEEIGKATEPEGR